MDHFPIIPVPFLFIFLIVKISLPLTRQAYKIHSKKTILLEVFILCIHNILRMSLFPSQGPKCNNIYMCSHLVSVAVQSPPALHLHPRRSEEWHPFTTLYRKIPSFSIAHVPLHWPTSQGRLPTRSVPTTTKVYITAAAIICYHLRHRRHLQQPPLSAHPAIRNTLPLLMEVSAVQSCKQYLLGRCNHLTIPFKPAVALGL